jgi:serpin B
LARLDIQKVKTYVPKFKLETCFRLMPTLKALGMKLAFSPRADFTGISGKEDLYFSEVVHKAFVDVNEEGTEAAGATAAVGRCAIPTFCADHPFLFLIRDTNRGSILFMGRVVDPNR